MNLADKIKQLREKADNPPGFWPDANDAEPILRSLLRNNTDNILRLVEAAKLVDREMKVRPFNPDSAVFAILGNAVKPFLKEQAE